MNTTPVIDIDIYADNPVVTLAYKIAVMQKALEIGVDHVQARATENMAVATYGAGWKKAQCPIQLRVYGPIVWNWASYIFRIDPAAKPFVMPGYNPMELDSQVVGLLDGWRLLHDDEITHVTIVNKSDVQCHFEFMFVAGIAPHWEPCSGRIGNLPRPSIWVKPDGYTYRTKLTKEQVLALQ